MPPPTETARKDSRMVWHGEDAEFRIGGQSQFSRKKAMRDEKIKVGLEREREMREGEKDWS